MLTGIHFLLTYACNYECDHCFLYCGPSSKGTFTMDQIEQVLDEADKIDSMEWIYFEGGEPFLYYPLMIEGIKSVKERGYKVGIVTNSYWATCEKDAEIWIKPMIQYDIKDFTVSDDEFHFGTEAANLSKIASKSATNLGLPVGKISINEPTVEYGIEKEHEKGTPVIGGGAMFRGRAIDTLTKDLPQRYWEDLISCPYEDLEGLGRVHVDSYGNTQICQGLSIGNYWETKLSEIVKSYDPNSHPIIGPLIQGGPAELVRKYSIEHNNTYVDECHLCFLARKAIINKFPQYLGPKQVYGIEE
ncbi:MAG: radical SAM protein [Candidatus Hodarchaeota archaeon]